MGRRPRSVRSPRRRREPSGRRASTVGFDRSSRRPIGRRMCSIAPTTAVAAHRGHARQPSGALDPHVAAPLTITSSISGSSSHRSRPPSGERSATTSITPRSAARASTTAASRAPTARHRRHGLRQGRDGLRRRPARRARVRRRRMSAPGRVRRPARCPWDGSRLLSTAQGDEARASDQQRVLGRLVQRVRWATGAGVDDERGRGAKQWPVATTGRRERWHRLAGSAGRRRERSMARRASSAGPRRGRGQPSVTPGPVGSSSPSAVAQSPPRSTSVAGWPAAEPNAIAQPTTVVPLPPFAAQQIIMTPPPRTDRLRIGGSRRRNLSTPRRVPTWSVSSLRSVVGGGVWAPGGLHRLQSG